MAGETYNTNDKSFTKRGPRRNVIPGGNDGEDIEHDKGSDGGNTEWSAKSQCVCHMQLTQRYLQIYWTATELVNQEGEKEVLAQRQRFHTTIDTKLCLRVSQANVILR
jgi:hypothetical protein